MKKSLVLAMAMALGVTASAYAANPFSDVPAGHWAYDSVNKLAAAGIVDGYGNGTFGGDRLMTRYEMAQIVAKAMAKGANVDRLAAEFADELDSLGVRVAALEKKSDNVKINGEARFRYMDSDKDGYTNDLRSRIWVKGQVNDDWSYTGMLENVQDFKNDNGDEDVNFQRAYVEGKIGGLNVLAGRYNAFFANGNIYDTRADGIEVSYGEKVKITGYVGKGTDGTLGFFERKDGKLVKGEETYGNYAGGAVSADIAKGLNLAAGYINVKDIGDIEDAENAIWHAGLIYTAGDVTLSGMYLKGDADGAAKEVKGKKLDDDGYVFGLSYKGAEAAEVNSWGIWANYYNQGGQTYLAHTTDANTFDNEGFKGYGVGVNYTFAKNIVGTVAYYDTESKVTNADDQIIWTDLTFTF
ncbi:S-layer homology domain-containing protein [Phascolarctobacterium faecium]|uniref:S-layer homology domain-containing protein n=1 Tax=Phascolarctobacterium faecium TaxID=33025 RepID=UPI003F747BAC